MADYPHVSVVMSTYQRPVLMYRALHSIYAQTFKDFEVIVVHDGPMKHNVMMALERIEPLFKQRGINLIAMGLDENSGYQCVPKNAGITVARGDYIAYLDDDNTWMPEHLEVLVEEIERGEDWPDFTYGRREYIDDRLDKDKELYTGNSPFVEYNEEAKKRLAAGPMTNFIDTSDVLMSKGSLWRCQLATGKMWNHEIRRFGDWELLTRGVFFSGWRGRGVDKVITKYYWHGENLQLTRPMHESAVQRAAL